MPFRQRAHEYTRHTQENTQVRYISYSMFQHSAVVQKPGRALEPRDSKFGQKKNFKASLQDGSAPNFHSSCICVTAALF